MSDLNGNLLSAALHYAQLGYPVFPCAPNGKAPLTSHGFKDATADATQINKWWSEHPHANIGIPTGGLLAVDVDGADNSWLRETPDRLTDLTHCPTSLTPRGGRHHLFRQPKDRSWKNTAGKIASKVDTRASGGYIVVPPSMVNGKAYAWTDGVGLKIGPFALPEPPQWLCALLDGTNADLFSQVSPVKGQIPDPRPESELPSPDRTHPADGNLIPSGQRNATLARLAGAMRRVGMGQAEILAALTQTNALRCKPPIGAREVERIAASISRYEPDQVSVAVVENHWGQERNNSTDNDSSDEEGSDPGVLPDGLFRVPGFISEVMDFSLKTAPYPNVVLAFSGALALQAFLAGRKVRDPGDNRTNVYILGLAHSASGKDWPRKTNVRILHEIGLAGHLGEKFASGEGIQDALFSNPCMLFQTDEIDGLLQQINKAQDARHESIVSTLLTLYSSANTITPMRRKAGDESPGVIHQPCLVLFGTAIPNNWYSALSERMLTNGLFARMIVLESEKRQRGQEPSIIPLPDRVLATARWWGDYRPGEVLEEGPPTPAVVEHTAEAKGFLAECRESADDQYARCEQKNDPVGTTVWGRVGEQSRKLALIYAVSQNHEHPIIGAAAATWASLFAMHHARRMLFMAQTRAVETQFQAKCLKLTERLCGAPRRTMAHSVLLKRMKMDARSFKEIVTTLVERGDIKVHSQSTAGRPTCQYELMTKG
jgi:hypothetical protein